MVLAMTTIVFIWGRQWGLPGCSQEVSRVPGGFCVDVNVIWMLLLAVVLCIIPGQNVFLFARMSTPAWILWRICAGVHRGLQGASEPATLYSQALMFACAMPAKAFMDRQICLP